MGSDTIVVTQKIFQLIGLTNAVSICFLILFAFACVTKRIPIPNLWHCLNAHDV